MKILILGGTRLMGLALANRLANVGHEITVVSRKKVDFPNPVNLIVTDKMQFLTSQNDFNFDLVFDFLAYDANSVNRALSLTKNIPYVLISSTWMAKLNNEHLVDQLVKDINYSYLEHAPEITRNYLMGKNEAELAISEARKRGRLSAILRLPIFWGKNDHTGRLQFYLNRILDKNPILMIDHGINLTQIAWVEDLARAIEFGINSFISNERIIWECLPHEGLSVRSVVNDIAKSSNSHPEYVDVNKDTLINRLPEYLEAEPLWREFAFEISDSNLFYKFKIIATNQADWISKCAYSQLKFDYASLRQKEIDFIKHHA